MKQLLLLPLVFISLACFAQQDSVPEPDHAGRPYFLYDGKLLSLERADAVYDVNAVAFGYGGSNSYYSVLDPSSSIRFKHALPRLFIKLEGDVDVEDNPLIVSIGEVKKGRRKFEITGRGMFGSAKDIRGKFISPKLKKIRGSLYEIIFEQQLAPGEYAFLPLSGGGANPALTTATQTTKISCFGME